MHRLEQFVIVFRTDGTASFWMSAGWGILSSTITPVEAQSVPVVNSLTGQEGELIRLAAVPVM